jgi:hypothetical protein
MGMTEDEVARVFNDFVIDHYETVTDPLTRLLLPFELVEPWLQDYCGDVGVSYLRLREGLIENGYVIDEEEE